MAKIILGFVGPVASGKGTVCQYLKEKHQASVYRFSTILRNILDQLYLAQNRKNMQDLFLTLEQTFGDGVLSSAMANQVNSDSAIIIAIDGVRREADIKGLKDLPGFHLIFITADQKIRWQRIVKRGENTDDAQKTFSQFQKDEENEAEQQIKTVAKLAKYTIDNNGNLEQLYQQVEEILKKINEN
jgi:dephospho-CoA kinase